ncbi:hypothetical protein D3C71_1867520 [compost metagenome]
MLLASGYIEVVGFGYPKYQSRASTAISSTGPDSRKRMLLASGYIETGPDGSFLRFAFFAIRRKIPGAANFFK